MSVTSLTDHSRKLLRFTSHGVAEYLESTPVRQRQILLDYLFPEDSKPKILQRQPARQLAQKYFLSGCDPTVLHDAIDQYSKQPFDEKPHARSRRLSALEAADHLPKIAGKYRLIGQQIGNRLSIPISGLLVGSSVDLIAVDEKRGIFVAVIFNTATSIAKSDARLKHYAKIQCEVALRALRANKSRAIEVWFIDVCSSRRVRALVSPVQQTWRNIEVACDKIAIEMRELLQRRQRVASVVPL